MLLLRLLVLAIGLILTFGALATFIIARRIEARFPPGGRFVPVTGGRLHYLEAGPPDGRARGTVVLLHGASANAADPMLALGGRLADRYRVLAFDRPGHGWSDRIPGAEAASPARQATAIAEALRRLDVAKAVVVGHSYAGSLLPHLALDHPDVTGAILIVAGVTHPWPGEAISWYYTSAASALGWLFTRTLTAPLGSVLIGPTVKTVFAPQAAPAAYAEKAQIALVLRPPVFRANADDVAALHSAVSAQSARYGDIRIPATILGGDRDTIVSTDLHGRAFAGAVAGAKLVILPGAGHMPHHTHAEAVAAEIEALAERVRGSTAATVSEGFAR